ncbi:MAG TPA: zf-TFIIB domain-containing protein [Myxococcota bacterium]|nr:zf-TFIIB domain-containing protein [Myxococcota bacterium]
MPVKLIACPDCHAQYDVSAMALHGHFDCRCGATLEATPPTGTDAPVQRCSACGALAKESSESCDYCGSAIVLLTDRGSLICPECYARNADDARFCLGCGVAFDPQIPRSDAPELRCPCCECWMTPRAVGGIEIQECPKCFGLWAPEDRFDALVDRATKAARERDQPGGSFTPRVDGGNPARSQVVYRRCPACDALMARRNFQKRSGVIVDRCHDHGTWLDAHELERIAGFVLSGRASEARRLETSAAAARERAAARAAAARIGSPPLERERVGSVFSTRRERSPVETIFDLLSTLLT